MADDKVTRLHDPEEGVVSFGIRPPGYTAVVEGREVPGLLVWERGDLITILLDRRFAIDVPRELSGAVCWLVAQARAIGEGYPYLGAESRDRPFAPQARGPYGPPDSTGGGRDPAFDPVNPAATAAPSALSDAQGPSIEPMPWVSLRDQEQAEAWIEGASEEALRAMAVRLMKEVPARPEEVAPLQLIMLAVTASARLWRRVLEAYEGDQPKRYRFSAPVSAQGTPS